MTFYLATIAIITGILMTALPAQATQIAAIGLLVGGIVALITVTEEGK